MCFTSLLQLATVLALVVMSHLNKASTIGLIDIVLQIYIGLLPITARGGFRLGLMALSSREQCTLAHCGHQLTRFFHYLQKDLARKNFHFHPTCDI